MTRVLVVRLDSMGDVLLAGPAAQALAEHADVDMLTSSIGRPVAALLPGVDRVIEFDAPWIRSPAPPVDPCALDDLVAWVRRGQYDAAAVLGSSHQSPLPTALFLRLAGVDEIAAVSHDYAGSLLDHRLRGDPDVHEVRRGLMVAAALGARGHDRPMRVVGVGCEAPRPNRVVVHPGASVPARTLPPARWAAVVRELRRCGADVVVTGSVDERRLCRDVAGGGLAADVAVSTFGRDDVAGLARMLSTASVVVSGNTGPMHLAAAVGRPVVAVFPPTVPAARWAPWMVPHVLLGVQDIECAGCRAIECAHQRCLDPIVPTGVADAVVGLMSQSTSEREVTV